MDRLFVWRRTAAGVLCGVLIAVSAYMLQLLVERELISWAVLVRFHRLYPLFYAVDLLPVILGVVFWLVRPAWMPRWPRSSMRCSSATSSC